MSATRSRLSSALAILLASFAALQTPVGAGSIESRAQAMQVEVAKTRLRVYVYVDAPPASARFSMRLSTLDSDGTWSPFAGANGTVEPGRFTTPLPRPDAGNCRVKAVTKDARRNMLVRGVEFFPCFIPSFEVTTASLDPGVGSPGAPARQIDVWVADDGTEQSHGLMYRRRMPVDRGMVFLFEEPGQGGFYMLNTLIPLSIAFFDAKGVIVDILDMEPCPDEPCPTYTPDAPYSGALEVNRGAFGTWGISEGDTVTVDNP